MGLIVEKNSFSPSNIASIWLDADDVAGADGSNPASLTDRVAGIVWTPEGATGGSLETTGWNASQKSIKQSNQAWKSSSPVVATVFGSGVSWWVAMVAYLTGYTTNYWSIGNSADAQKYLAVQTTNAAKKQQFIQRSGATAETQDASPELQWYSPQFLLWICDAAGVHTFYRDGILEQTFTRLPAALSADKALIGGLVQGGASTVQSALRWRQWIAGVNAGSTAMDASNIAKMKTWVMNNNQGFRVKKGMSGGLWNRTYHHFGKQGQSNHQGQGVAPYTTVTAPNVYLHKMNSFVDTLADPTSTNTGTPYPIFINSGVGSQYPALANSLYALGKYTQNDAYIYTPNAVSGIAASTCASGYATDPPDPDTFIGAVKYRCLEIWRNFPNVKAVSETWQGESEAQTSGGPANWTTHSTNIQGAIDSWMTVWGAYYGVSWIDSNNRHIIDELPATGPDPGAGFDFWQQVRAAQATFVTNNAGSTLNQITNGPWTLTGVAFLHINEAAQNTQGPLTAALMPSL